MSEHPNVRNSSVNMYSEDEKEDDIVELEESHATMVKEAKDFQLTFKLRTEYYNRLARLIDFIELKYPAHFKRIEREITHAQYNDGNRYYHKMKRDINYSLLNADIFQAFLMKTSIKPNWNMCSFFNKQKCMILCCMEQNSKKIDVQFLLKY